MKQTIFLLALALLAGPASAQTGFDLSSLGAAGIPSAGADLPAPKPERITDGKVLSCAGYTLKMKLRGRTVTLPATGVWTLESHLSTQDDVFPANRSFPKSTQENIGGHLDKSCALLARLIPGANCAEVYQDKWSRVWTPPENGKAGQGSLGDVRPSKEEEMWIFNMMWVGKAMPPAGTKFLATYNGRSVVVVGGYERGPSSSHFLGGFQREVLWALGAEFDSSKITLSTLLDQSLPPGPVTCAK